MKQHFLNGIKKNLSLLFFFFIILLTSNCKKENDLPEIEIEYLQSNILYDNEGNVYRTVVIGNQVWMAENLNTSVHDYGYSSCYDNLPGNCYEYGRLYTWDAIMNGEPQSIDNPSGVRGICPAGWHIPSDAEWRQLEVFLGMTPNESLSNNWRGTDQGTKLKSISGWNNGGNGTDNYGFTALPGGNKVPITGWGSLGVFGYWWTSSWSGSSENLYISRSLKNSESGINRSSQLQNVMISVRCVKN